VAENGEWDWGQGLGAVTSLGTAAFQWMSARDRARYEAENQQAWAESYAQAAPAIAASQSASAFGIAVGRDKLLIAGFAILAVVVLFRIRPTANG